MNNKDVGNNEEEKKGINIVTLVVCIFVVIFVAAGFASGGVVPAVMTVLVILFVTNSLKKQFRVQRRLWILRRILLNLMIKRRLYCVQV